jgi:hypothetical protein
VRFITPALVPAARTVLAVVLTLATGACRSPVTAPEEMPGASAAVAMPLLGPPVTGPLGIRTVRMLPDGGDLVISVQYARPRTKIGYAPFTPGGWCFQVFLDTDQAPTGYLGYDFLTRDTEGDLGGNLIRVRRTTGGEEGTPGGWGEEVAVVPLIGTDARIMFRVPLAALDGDDGRAAYRVEFYRTIACEECEGGIAYEYVFHVTGITGGSPPLIVRRDKDGLLSRLRS